MDYILHGTESDERLGAIFYLQKPTVSQDVTDPNII